MAEKLCTLRTKGGGGGAKQEETVLWTNSAPTSTFNAQTVTLSDSVRNYDYLKFVYNLNNENQNACSTIMSVSDFVNTKYQAGYFVGEFGCMATTSGTLYPWARPAHYDTDTTIAIKNCITVGTSVTINTRLIPTAIIGIKNMGGKSDKPQFTLLSNYVSTTLNLTTITLDKDITKYNYIIATSNVMPNGYNSFVASKAAVEAIIDIQTFISRGSVTYGSALSNGTAYSITLNYIDSTHISTSRTSATNRNLTFYAI